ncbi:HWE histidine kinase domain-containing protein [Yoonia sp. SS1-5]|uniref:histidine kinase n=1 Tax=Yoonia rhodophyticola TaxID=3137370 RepID=A0AAN0MA76_9RHOB
MSNVSRFPPMQTRAEHNLMQHPPRPDPSAPLRAAMALDAGGMASWSLDLQPGTIMGDPLAGYLLGQAGRPQPWSLRKVLARLHREDLGKIGILSTRLRSGEDSAQIMLRHLDRGRQHWLGIRGKVISRSPDGTLKRVVGVIWDAAMPQDLLHQQDKMTAELDHQVKNAFAVMRALVNIERRSAQSVEEFAALLNGQITAMANAHALSSLAAEHTAISGALVGVPDIVEAALGDWLYPDQGALPVANLNIETAPRMLPAKVSAFMLFLGDLVSDVRRSAPPEAAQITATISAADEAHAVLTWQNELTENEYKPSPLARHCLRMLGAELRLRTTSDPACIDVILPIDG